MKANDLLAILTCVNLLVIHKLDAYDSSRYVADYLLDPRIIYGSPTDLSRFPYLVRLRISGTLCAGSIIAGNWILTAAHCTDSGPCRGIEIYPAAWGNSAVAYPYQCYIHPQYRSGGKTYDISLLFTQINLLQDGRAATISLPPPGIQLSVGTSAVIVGWGQTETGRYADRLLATEVRLEDWNVCNLRYKQNTCGSDMSCQAVTQIPRRIICTQGVGSQPPGTCFGDSGGPVIINGFVVGIVSFGILNNGLCVIGNPSMQVYVPDYLPWILNLVNPSIDTSQYPVQMEY